MRRRQAPLCLLPARPRCPQLLALVRARHRLRCRSIDTIRSPLIGQGLWAFCCGAVCSGAGGNPWIRAVPDCLSPSRPCWSCPTGRSGGRPQHREDPCNLCYPCGLLLSKCFLGGGSAIRYYRESIYRRSCWPVSTRRLRRPRSHPPIVWPSFPAAGTFGILGFTHLSAAALTAKEALIGKVGGSCCRVMTPSTD